MTVDDALRQIAEAAALKAITPVVTKAVDDATQKTFEKSADFQAIFASPDYLESERQVRLWELRGNYIDAMARFCAPPGVTVPDGTWDAMDAACTALLEALEEGS